MDADDPLRSDRIPALHFARAPGDYFAREGHFTIEILGLDAGVALPAPAPDAVRSLADPALLTGSHLFERLDQPRRSGDDTLLELVAVLLVATPDGPVARPRQWAWRPPAASRCCG